MTLHSKGELSGAQWAYCPHCERDVELRPSGRLAPHTTHTGAGWAEVACKGSLRLPAPRPREGGDDGSTANDGMRKGPA